MLDNSNQVGGALIATFSRDLLIQTPYSKAFQLAWFFVLQIRRFALLYLWPAITASSASRKASFSCEVPIVTRIACPSIG